MQTTDSKSVKVYANYVIIAPVQKRSVRNHMIKGAAKSVGLLAGTMIFMAVADVVVTGIVNKVRGESSENDDDGKIIDGEIVD